MSTCFAYQGAPYAIPEYKAEAHRGAWDYLSRPGSWWSGDERIAIAAASRAALACPLCVERKAALSPYAVDGRHVSVPSVLDASVIDTIHRITTDPARLTEDWVAGRITEAFGYGHYIEMVSVIVTVISIDTLHRALGLPLEPLPAPVPGDPDRYRPPGAARDVAWVPMIYPENLTEREDDIYFGAPRVGHVIRALSLVPDAVRWLARLSEAHYVSMPEVMDFGASGHLTLSRPQIELVAARTSRVNDCFY
ncbi:MAG: alkylhydroperoxidase-related (seleno)protein [Gammaproteobacteria bacterium]|jgi:hypothetical protein